MSVYVSTLTVRRVRGARARRSAGGALRWLALAAVVLGVLGGAVALPQRAYAASAVVIPEQIGSFARAGGERWGYLYSNAKGVGASIGKGARSDTRKVTRTIEYGITAQRGGLRLDATAEHTVRYEVYVSGVKKGKIHRVFQPKVTFRSASARLFYLWKLNVSLKSRILSVTEAVGGAQTYRVRHQVSLTLPRQPLMPRSRWIELARQLAAVQTDPYIRSVTIVPNGEFGRLVVGFE